jgi:hypothetical protein
MTHPSSQTGEPFMTRRRTSVAGLVAALAVTAAVSATAAAGPAVAATGPSGSTIAREISAATGTPVSRVCPPDAVALGFSDALDKVVYDGATIGGLSDIAYDRRSNSYVSSVDNHLTDPSRLWFYRDLSSPRIVRDPLVLKAPDGTPYTGATADNEGLAVLPDGDFLVSSETEPSIRIFGRDGVQRSELAVPARFDVAPAGEATSNATLEGLTVSPDGRQVVAAMEGTLSGDVAADGTNTYRRFLVYDRGAHGSYRLDREVGYQVDPGNRISEVQFYADGRVVVMEAAFDPVVGNTIQLYAVPGLSRAKDVTKVANLSTRPDLVMAKSLVADVTKCPTLGAMAKQPQTNPLMDNYEGMTIRPILGRHIAAITLISDDNFGATQITRVLDLAAILP